MFLTNDNKKINGLELKMRLIDFKETKEAVIDHHTKINQFIKLGLILRKKRKGKNHMLYEVLNNAPREEGEKK